MGDEVLLGPGQDGSFRNVKVHDLRRNRLPCNMIRAGQVATIALPNIERSAVRHVSEPGLGRVVVCQCGACIGKDKGTTSLSSILEY